ncbi:MAG: hypothetical protein VKO39_03735 [Cyanobacteriota bacterium]|nr:hypothetical protein [Cyanobacteriota bacterium]
MNTNFKGMRTGLAIAITTTTAFFTTLSGWPVLAQTGALPSRPVWEPTSAEPYVRTLRWMTVQDFGILPAQFSPVPAQFTPAELAARPRVEGPYKGRGIFGVGGGLRASTYTGDPTNALLTTRFGYKLDDHFSLSIRPTNIFSDYNNNNNNNNFFNNTEFRLPLTLDLFHQSFFSPYIGGGLATNADGLGYTDGMLTGGLDINVTKFLTLGLNVNYIYQTNIDDTDWEALGMLYLRF